MSAYETVHLNDVDAVGAWRPIRRRLGIEAFGVNAWTGDDGAEVIPAHDERPTGHEELYLVVEGRATFTVGEDTIDAPAGTIVLVRDPGALRGAVAAESGTTIFTVGAKPGEAYTPQPWELNREAFPLFDEGEYARAKQLLEEGMGQYGEHATLLYNLACAESRLGESEPALEHLRRATELDAQFAEFAQEDEDLEGIRDDARFPRSERLTQ